MSRSNFDDCNPIRAPFPADVPGDRSPDTLAHLLKRDRFELLSAYLDGEVTADERRQVEDWLKTDPTMQCLYARLLKLRQGLRTIPIPESEQPVEQFAAQVVSRIERRPKRTILWGGMAIAAVFMGVVMGTLPREPGFQVADSPSPITESPSRMATSIPDEGLMIALDRPPIPIPKAAVSGSKPLQAQPSDSRIQ
ncbi:MAG: Fis family transcriptional regulator [Cyanobacteria bacterium RU_5_0]|nr:Fis family transcriptional regulator [Cyanobacteria bacterium RU_5_0]